MTGVVLGASGCDAPTRSARPVADATPTRRGAPTYEGCFITFDAPSPPSPTEEGRLRLRFTLDPDTRGEVVALELAILDCAGAGAGPLRDAGWTRVPTRARRERLEAGRPVVVAEGPLPAGAYDRVFAAVDGAHAWTAGGEELALHAHVEPIARGVRLAPGETVTIDIVLTVQPRPRFQGGGWNLFVRDARTTGAPTP